MSTQNVSTHEKNELDQGVPIQLKLLLAVIVVAVGAIIVKLIGIL